MTHDEADRLDDDALGEERARAPRRWRLFALVIAVLLAAVLGALWLGRERIAENIIAGQLAKSGLPASYEIAGIGPRRQVLRKLVIGDLARPDLTVDEVTVAIAVHWGLPRIGRITLTRPRLYGTYRNGKASFGSLDKVLFTGGTQPFRMPDLDLAIDDGRALIETEGGPVGVKLAGAGALRGGFAGTLAVAAPRLALGGCEAGRLSLYGRLATEQERPRFTGPLRLGALDCGDDGTRLRDAAVQIDASFDPALDGADGRLALRSGELAAGEARLASMAGDARFTWRGGELTGRYELAGKGAASSQVRASMLAAEGMVRTSGGFARIDIDGTLEANGVATGEAPDRALAAMAAAGKGTLLEPVAAQVRAALRREGANSRLSGSYVVRQAGDVLNLTVPQATLRGASGASLLALSRLQVTAGRDVPVRVSGNFASGGQGLPRISGRMERAGAGGLHLRLTMAEYAAGSARIALPELRIAQGAGGSLGFAGQARLSGDLPGGRAENLVLPLDGNWSAARGLAMWRQCAAVRFDRLALASLVLDGRTLRLCPPRGRAMLESDRAGTRIAAGAPSLAVSGRLGGTPVRIASGPIGFAMPGNLSARALDVALGPPATASRFRIAGLSARLGKSIAGHFDGADVLLDAVPLDIRDAAGDWSFADGRLSLEGAAFRLEDRAAVDRFKPVVSRAGALTLADNRIAATALLLEPASGRDVLRTVIAHDLSGGTGHADLIVDGLDFDDAMQPDTLTPLALGVIANAEGTLRGQGRIDWSDAGVTSTGSFTTDRLDFAAAFGPVTGASGTIEFTDLLGLVSAPDQKLRLATMNPGIEVTDGEIVYELRGNNQLAVKGGTWPFLAGTLVLDPTVINMAVAETRYFTLRIDGLDAARLLAQMDLANLSMNGVFDGVVPLVFDEEGGRIVGGRLQSRPPGGNLSYVGELTYEDLSPMANFTFQTLRSLDFRSMGVELEGSLDGEIITHLKFDGVRQGKGARRNFLTRQLGRLPIRLDVNITAPFFNLVTSLRAMYDPAYIRDPRALGLIDDQGRPLAPPPGPATAPPPPIQPPESETKP